MYSSDSQLRHLVIRQVDEIKRQYQMWRDPNRLAAAIGIPVKYGSMSGQEGALINDVIVLNPLVGSFGRRQFTFYHEIAHWLIRKNDELYAILHDQYSSNDSLMRAVEHLCNVGAAEFLVPREGVLAAITVSGFSISLLRTLHNETEGSLTAISVQLALCATHRCIVTVCRMLPTSDTGNVPLLGQVPIGLMLKVDVAISSQAMRYSVARGATIPSSHLFLDAYRADDGQVWAGRAPIPLSRRQGWVVDCEALRIGQQLFGVFHVDRPPTSRRDQPHLPLG